MKKLISIFFILVMMIASIRLTSANQPDAQDEWDLVSKYVIIHNIDENKIIYEKNAHEPMYPASLTKIMTTLVALEQIEQLDTEIVLDEQVFAGLAEAQASVAGYQVGDHARLIDLLYGIMLPSGADAARAIALYVAGSEENFVKLMNEKAESLHLEHTHFVNVTGLHDDNHYSTASDLSIILQNALKQETFANIYKTKHYQSVDQTKEFYASGAMFADQANLDGSFLLGAKTGYTPEAGLCLSFLTKVNDASYVIILGDAGKEIDTFQHVLDGKRIYDHLAAHYSLKTLYHANDTVGQMPISYGTVDSVDVHVNEPVSILVKDDAYQKEMDTETISAPIESGEAISKLHVSTAQGEHTYALYASQQVKKNWVLYLGHAWWFYVIALGIAMFVWFYGKRIRKHNKRHRKIFRNKQRVRK